MRSKRKWGKRIRFLVRGRISLSCAVDSVGGEGARVWDLLTGRKVNWVSSAFGSRNGRHAKRGRFSWLLVMLDSRMHRIVREGACVRDRLTRRKLDGVAEA